MRNPNPHNITTEERKKRQSEKGEEALNGQAKKIRCIGKCNSEKRMNLFFKYNSNSPKHKNYETLGVLPYCKECLNALCLDSNGILNLEDIRKAVQWLDLPFIEDKILQEIRDGKFQLGLYYKNIVLNASYRNFTYEQWEEKLKEVDKTESTKKNAINFQIEDADVFSFKVTKDMLKLWGSKYEPEDYFELQNFYNDMMLSNTIESAGDFAYLKKLAIISLNMDKALQKGNSGEAKQLGDLFSKYMADSKFRAMDKTDADKTGGIRNFSAIYSELGKDGFIPPWEHYRKIKGITQDIVDKTIMHIENFTLKLNKIEKMTTPPRDTPKLEDYEIDRDNVIEINDIEVDMNLDETMEYEDFEGEE